jgi:ribosomal protein S30
MDKTPKIKNKEKNNLSPFSKINIERFVWENKYNKQNIYF